MSRQCKENHNYVKQTTFGKGSRNQRNAYSGLGKNSPVPRTRRESYRKTVYPSHEKRNRRNG